MVVPADSLGRWQQWQQAADKAEDDVVMGSSGTSQAAVAFITTTAVLGAPHTTIIGSDNSSLFLFLFTFTPKTQVLQLQ